MRSRRARWTGGDEPQFILDLVHSVQADPALLRQLLDNLVENAMKYAVAPSVAPVAVALTCQEDAGDLVLTVEDDGRAAEDIAEAA